MELIKAFGDRVRDLWSNLNPNQKVYYAVAAAILAVTLAGIAGVAGLWGGEGAMRRVVGHDASPEEHRQVLDLVREKNIPYKVVAGEIYVDPRKADELAMDVQGRLSPEAYQKFIFDSDIFSTRWQNEKRYQIAVQQKLERLIRNVDGVVRAGVVLVPGKESGLFRSRGRGASASVQVELRPGERLNRSSIKAIIGFVAHAVPNLESDKVQLIDTSGNEYRLPPADSVAASAANMNELEREKAETLKAQIREVVPVGSRIAVNVKLRRTDIEKVQETHGNGAKEEGEERGRRQSDRRAGGVPGIKGRQSVEHVETEPADRRDEWEFESKEKNRVDWQRTQTDDPAGGIEEVTVSVVLPHGTVGDLAMWKDVVMKASGVGAEEDVSVVIGPAPQTAAVPAGRPPVSGSDPGFLDRHGSTIGYGVLILAALVLVAWFLGRALPRGDVMEDMARRLEGVTGEAMEPALPGTGPPETDVGRMKVGIREMVNRDPRSAAGIVNRWLLGR